VELQIHQGFDEACLLMEACRLQAKASSLQMQKSRSNVTDAARAEASEPLDEVSLEQFHHMLEPIIKPGAGAHRGILQSLDLQARPPPAVSCPDLASRPGCVTAYIYGSASLSWSPSPSFRS